VADLGEGDGGPAPPLILGKNESQKKEKQAGQAKQKPAPPLSSRSGSATALGINSTVSDK